MLTESKYYYRIRISSASEVIEFTKQAIRYPGELTLVNGKHRLNAKSCLGVALARVSWDEIFLESDTDCYFSFEKFIT